MGLFERIKDAISGMRYGNGVEKASYWFIRVAVILVPIFIVLIIAGTIYCNINGITIGI